MAKIGTITLTGLCSRKYEFDVYPIGTHFNDVGGLYYISRRTEEHGSRPHSDVYTGQTGELSARFNDHHKEPCFKRNGANCIRIYADNNEESRLVKGKGLIKARKWPCNG